MDQKSELTVTSDLKQSDFESELDTAWSIVKRDPELKAELKNAGIDPDRLPLNRADAVQVRSTSAAYIPGLVEYLIAVAAGLTVELIVALTKVVQSRRGAKAAEVKH